MEIVSNDSPLKILPPMWVCEVDVFLEPYPVGHIAKARDPQFKYFPADPQALQAPNATPHLPRPHYLALFHAADLKAEKITRMATQNKD